LYPLSPGGQKVFKKDSVILQMRGSVAQHIEEGWPLSSANIISLLLRLVQKDEGCLQTLVAKLSRLVVVKGLWDLQRQTGADC
jgi:hypothetical protein